MNNENENYSDPWVTLGNLTRNVWEFLRAKEDRANVKANQNDVDEQPVHSNLPTGDEDQNGNGNRDEQHSDHVSPSGLVGNFTSTATLRNSSAMMFAIRPTHSLQMLQDDPTIRRNTSS